jgi:hypothetical protein
VDRFSGYAGVAVTLQAGEQVQVATTDELGRVEFGRIRREKL